MFINLKDGGHYMKPEKWETFKVSSSRLETLEFQETLTHRGIVMGNVRATFKDSKHSRYIYYNVPKRLFLEIVNNRESVGKAFQNLIKMGVRYEKIQ